MVFALCDEEDFLGLLQSAGQLRQESGDGRKLEKRNWEDGALREGLREKVTFSEEIERRDVQRGRSSGKCWHRRPLHRIRKS